MIYRSATFTTMLVITLFSLSTVAINNSVSAYEKHTKESQKAAPDLLNGKVISVMDVAGYTYAEVDTGKQKVWVAGPVTRLKVGELISFSSTMPMENYHSKSMKRDFSILYFVGGFYGKDGIPVGGKTDMASPHGEIKKKRVAEKLKGVTRAKGGRTIAEIYSQKDRLKDKKIRVRGKVTKFSAEIMDSNWIHIRDSSSLLDLTLTTKDVARVGDIVVLEGKLGLEKDFGYGYVYPVILQDAKVIGK